jgi:hypothetical protein
MYFITRNFGCMITKSIQRHIILAKINLQAALVIGFNFHIINV